MRRYRFALLMFCFFSAVLPTVTSSDPSSVNRANAATAATRVWIKAEYLLWFAKDSPMPTPLFATGSEFDPLPGVGGQPNTEVLFGGDGIDYSLFSGLRIEGGLWVGPAASMAIEAGGFRLTEVSEAYHATGGDDGAVFFGRPYIDAITGDPGLFPISQNFSDPASSAHMTGSTDVETSLSAWGWEVNGAVAAYDFIATASHGLLGFRALGMDEDLDIRTVSWNLDPGGGASYLGTPIDLDHQVHVLDQFKAHNRFWGPQVGTRLLWEFGPITVTVLGKVAAGVSQELVSVEGQTTILENGEVLARSPQGVLAQSSNIGRYCRNEFAVIPEGRFDLGYRLTSYAEVHIGYTFLYWSSLLRPGRMIDPFTDPATVPISADYEGSAVSPRPQVRFDSSDFWLQGAEFGLIVRF